MAVSFRPKEATYLINTTLSVTTKDHEDHHFAGILFPLICKSTLPIQRLVITSLSVRGDLGPITVWVGKETFLEKDTAPDEMIKEPVLPCKGENANGRPLHEWGEGNSMENAPPPPPPPTSPSKSYGVANSKENPDYWAEDESDLSYGLRLSHYKRIYSATHPPSPTNLVKLVLNVPIVLAPGEGVPVYIHSTLPGDSAIVYDQQSGYRRGPSSASASTPTYSDAYVKILPGIAHVSNEVFGRNSIWGHGGAWRSSREFVGSLEFGVCYALWQPQKRMRARFGTGFDKAIMTLLMGARRSDCLLTMLPDDVLYFTMNMLPWDWFEDSVDHMMLRAGEEKIPEPAPQPYFSIGGGAGRHFSLSQLQEFLHAYGIDVPTSPTAVLSAVQELIQYQMGGDDEEDEDWVEEDENEGEGEGAEVVVDEGEISTEEDDDDDGPMPPTPPSVGNLDLDNNNNNS